ncbi:MAG TPA: nickel-dependent hydrogenase large subunit [Candidatus Dormibacteraeota bacterium]|nr:nickel-dependent hydrogenase large subunit [Candidatus Dormibacteraeota bacterium]
MARIVVDPITRIEGHLRIEAQVDGGKVSDAWSSGTMFRGIELIVRNRDPREVWLWTQRICAVCTMVHALASVRAVENALGIEVPDNARLVRNIISASQYIQDHVVHFYHLHALDWVDITGALKADPVKTSQLAQSISEWPKSSASYFRGVQGRVKALVESRQLSLFTSGYWGHPAYRLPPEADLMAVAHYLEALEFQRDFIRIHAVLGGKNPHLQSFLVGGMTTSLDPNEPQAPLNPERIDFLVQVAQTAKTFVDQVLIPDVLAVASFYQDWFSLGQGPGNYLSYGGFPQGGIQDTARYFMPQGIILNNDISKVYPVNPDKVAEYVTHSWYEYAEGDQVSKPPYDGETNPKYAGPKPPYEFLDVDKKYSWVKSPRYDDRVMEVGPLSRMLVAYASGQPEVKAMVDGVLAKFKAPPAALFSTLGRIAARALETQLLSNHIVEWIEQLRTNMHSGNLRIHNGEKWDPGTWPSSARGYGLFEAPRGSLGHWVEIENTLVKNYQIVVPTTWNAGPRDAKGQRGPYETALLKTPVADPERPLEILRTVHSFDPCLACAVHVADARGRTYARREA